MTTETLEKLYLEWSQFTQARTRREIALSDAMTKIAAILDACNVSDEVYRCALLDPNQSFDLTGFETQPSEIEDIETEWLREKAGGLNGDEIHATIAYLLGDRWFIIEFSS